MQIRIEPKKVLFVLGGILIFFFIVNIVCLISIYYFNHEYVFGLVPLFYLDVEGNIPNLFSSVILLICSALLILIFYAKKQDDQKEYRYWCGLSLTFLFLSIDEAVSIHERLELPLQKLLNTSGFLYFAWVIPYSVAMIIFLAIYLKFTLNLPEKIRNLFIISGTIFVSGALLIEFIEGKFAETDGVKNIIFSLISSCQEIMEMIGIILFIYAIMLYIDLFLNGISLNIKSKIK